MYRNSVGLIVGFLLTLGNITYCNGTKSLPSSFCGMLISNSSLQDTKREENIFSLFLELKDCQSFTATSYNYSSFYELHSITEKSEDHYLLDLKIHAIAQKDVYILLTPTTSILNDSQLFELGMW